MKSILSLVFLAAIPMALACQKIGTVSVSASGPIVTQLCKTANFDKVSVTSGIALNLRNASETRVTIQCAESIQPYIETVLEGSTLVIRVKPNTRLINPGKIVADVSVSTLKAISASGGSRITIDGTFSTNTGMAVSASGGGTITGNVSSKDFAMNISGGGNMAGNINAGGNVSMNLSGGSRYNGRIDASGNTSINSSGGAPVKGEIYCRDLKVNASGGGSVTFNGICGQFDVNCSGGGHAYCFGLVASGVKGNFSGGGGGEFTTTGQHNVSVSGGGHYTVKNPAGEVIGRK